MVVTRSGLIFVQDTEKPWVCEHRWKGWQKPELHSSVLLARQVCPVQCVFGSFRTGLVLRFYYWPCER